MCKISVITPVYKVENYLEKCIDSILNQTFTDFELIIVDDGSPDACGTMADKYEKADSRVIVIHKENGGAPSARNAGIEIARGEYFYFPDSDDWIEPTYLEMLYDLAQKSGAEMVISGYTMEYFEQGESQIYSVSVEEKIYSNRENVRNNLHSYFDNMMMAVPWNKLYKANYIRENKLKFPNVKWDDLHFNMEVIMDIDSVAISNSDGYHFFRSREGSETTTVFDGLLYKKRKEQFEHILKVYKHWNIKDKKIFSVLYGYYASRLVQCVQEIAISSEREKRRLIGEILHDELSRKAFGFGKINSKLLSIIAIPMKYQSITGSIVFGRVVGKIKDKMPALFYKLKSVSVNNAKTH